MQAKEEKKYQNTKRVDKNKNKKGNPKEGAPSPLQRNSGGEENEERKKEKKGKVVSKAQPTTNVQTTR